MSDKHEPAVVCDDAIGVAGSAEELSQRIDRVTRASRPSLRESSAERAAGILPEGAARAIQWAVKSTCKASALDAIS
jgi:hypothetical protein